MKINEKTREIHEELLENQDVSKAVTQLGNQHLARRNSSAIIVRHGEHYENANHQCETIEKRRAVGSFYKATYWAFKAISLRLLTNNTIVNDISHTTTRLSLAGCTFVTV